MDLTIEGRVVSVSSFLGGQSPEELVHLLQVRRKQCALELLAILKLLRDRDTPLSLEPERVLRTLSPATFAQLWSSPAAFFWTRLAFGFVHATRRDAMTLHFAEWLGIAETDLLPMLIERLWLLAITGLVIERQTYQLATPIPLPFMGSLPTLGISWQTTEQFQIVGTEAAGIQLMDAQGGIHKLATDASKEGLTVIEQPLLMVDTLFYLDAWSEPALASFNGIERAARVTNHHELAAQVKAFLSALENIKELLPGIHSEMGQLLQTATPLQPLLPGLPSSSNSAMTGAIWYTSTDQPTLLAEMLIHEHSHNKLFLLQDVDPLLDPILHGTGWDKCVYYSPWRDDPRPLNGIFHGYVVFSEAALFWACRLHSLPTEPLSLRRFGMLVRQLQNARDVLDEHCSFTPAGRELMRLLGQRMDKEFLPMAEALGTDQLAALHMESNSIFDIDPNSTIAATVRSHRHQWEMRLASQTS
jgi:HEXXH motif-containing protein